MNRDAAIRKVLACLRLGQSTNPNEAAAALRQARALMEKYGLTKADAIASEISAVEAATGFRGGMIPQSLVALSVLVADSYRCQVVINTSRLVGKTTAQFYGGGADAQIAAYAYTVLSRQLRAAKSKHTVRIRKRANRDRRGEEFALGWIHAVRNLLPPAESDDALAQAIDRAIAAHGNTQLTSGKDLRKHGRASDNDFHRGYVAGKNEQLHPGVSGTSQPTRGPGLPPAALPWRI